MDEQARKRMKRWHRRGLFGQLLVTKVNERFCPRCDRPHQPGPQPKNLAEHLEGDLGAAVYPAGSWGRPTVVVRFGRWRASSGRFFLSDYIPAEELTEFILLAKKVQASLAEFLPDKKQRRS